MSEPKSEEFDYALLQESAELIKSKLTFVPKLLLICGSGLGGIADSIEDPVTISYQDIPHFSKSTVEGHEGKLIAGNLSGATVICMKGRLHYFEGYSLRAITVPIRVMKLLGVQDMIITNAAGGVNKNYKVGDIMVIKDHLNFMAFGGQNPLRGPNDTTFGQRFFAMNKAYDTKLIEVARTVAQETGLGDHYREGVYGIYGGPNYETVAEVKLLQLLGVDAIGMSTIPEVLVARHCGIGVFGFSFITNPCVDSYESQYEPDHHNILEVVNVRSKQIVKFVAKIVEKSRERWL